MSRPIILASASPRRRELLESLKIPFEVRVSNVAEVLREGESPDAYVRRLSIDKARSVASSSPDELVLAADTIVYLDHAILEKPADPADAERMLGVIAGRTHTVFTGVSVVHGERRDILTEVERTDVTMASMSAEEIRWYVGTGEPMDKAGSYAVQGIGAAFVERIEGSYTNVVGLPLPLVKRMLGRVGAGLFTTGRTDASS